MALQTRPGTGWVQVTGTAAPLTTDSIPVPGGVAVMGDATFSIGNHAGITHKASATTDGFPIPANTIFSIPPGLFATGSPPNLNALYAISGGGDVNVWLIYPQGS